MRTDKEKKYSKLHQSKNLLNAIKIEVSKTVKILEKQF